jgi:Fe-S-cluster-containing dehydrogenase component
MCPFQAISFLSLHASFPSFFDLVEKKTVVTKCATTVNEYRESGKRQCAKFTPLSYL